MFCSLLPTISGCGAGGSTGTVPPAVVVTVSPPSASVVEKASQQFTASVTGTTNAAVTWTVSGAGCGGASCGTVSSSGLYTAPGAVPSPATVSVTATSESAPTQSASAQVTVTVLAGVTYYLAPAANGGSDSNDGLSPGAPWLSPNHAVNCGDVILAAASAYYSASNFNYGNWGTVTCAAGNNVAWLTCEEFDGCLMNGVGGVLIDQSYWGVQGWEVHATGTEGAGCFAAAPNYATPVEVHHVVFANDIANGCQEGGFGSYSANTSGVDYLAIVGNIAYNGSQGNQECFSGISVYQPVQSDTLGGTHIFVAGNFSWGNFEPDPCAGGQPTDGEGIILDTFDGRNGLPSAYAAQAVVEDNILFANGGKGLEVYANDAGVPPFASIYLLHNTMWGDNGDANQNSTYCGELLLGSAFNVQASYNLAVTNAAFGCGNNPIYAYYVGSSPTATDQIFDSWGYSASGTNDAVANSAGFSYGPNNTFGTNPGLANPVTLGAPSCGNATSVPDCMTAVIADFAPTTPAAVGFGYQAPSDTQVDDPLFPQWLCNVNLPAGLVTMACSTGSVMANVKRK